MSLIVATSRLAENTAQTDAEKPAHFINYFRSPIEIEPDSEIAVESVKIKRTGNITITAANYFTHTWGEDPLERSASTTGISGTDTTRVGPKYQVNVPRPIQLPPKTYELTEYSDKVKEVLNTMYADPRIFNNALVGINTDSAGREKGLDITLKARTTAINELANTAMTYYYNVRRPNANTNSSGLSFNPANGIIQRTAATSAIPSNTAAIGIIKNRPLCLNGGNFTYEFTNASANYVIVGLTRPFLQAKLNTGVKPSGAVSFKTKDLFPFKWKNDNKLITYAGTEQELAPRFHMDYGVMVSEQGVFIYNSAASSNRAEMRHYEIQYWQSGGSHSGARMTKSQFYASYDRVRFKGVYDGISVYFGQTGKPTYDQMCGPNLDADPNHCLKPISENTQALYPVINIGTSGVNTEIQELDAYDMTYKYPVYTEAANAGEPNIYTPGDDFYSNNRLRDRIAINLKGEAQEFYQYQPNRPTTAVKGAISHIDTATNIFINNQAQASPAVYPFSGSNASGAVAYKHTLSVGRIPKSDPGFLGLSAGLISSPNMGLQLGFADRGLLTQPQGVIDGYVTETTPVSILFTSPSELEKGAQSSFIRLPGLTHKSFNGGQQALSKFVYHVPQFSNDGREVGNLFFAPGEKTYVALMNPTKILLNHLQVQIVDVNEKEINSLTGTTQIVFHIRKRK